MITSNINGLVFYHLIRWNLVFPIRKEGAHLLLQTRVRTLNGELGALFKRWYPDMDLEVEEIPIAA